MKKARARFTEKERWELVVAHVKRSDEAATYLRTLLFALASGSAGFIFTQISASSLCVLSIYIASILAFAFAVALLVRSWEIQKFKAGQRYERLRDRDEQEYRSFKESMNVSIWTVNHKLDRLAAWSIGIGGVLALAAKVLDAL